MCPTFDGYVSDLLNTGKGRSPEMVWPVAADRRRLLPRGTEGRAPNVGRMTYERLIYAVRIALTVAMAVLVVAAAVTAS